MSARVYDSDEGEFVDFETLAEWEGRDKAKGARIEALEAALQAADELARAALACHPYVEELRCGDDLRAALAAYRRTAGEGEKQ